MTDQAIETTTSDEAQTPEEIKDEIADLYLSLLDSKKKWAIGLSAQMHINLNPMKNDAKEYLLADATTGEDDEWFFKKLGRNIKKKFLEKFTKWTELEYDHADLDKMKNLISQNKDNLAKLQELKTQIENGQDPTADAGVNTTAVMASGTVVAWWGSIASETLNTNKEALVFPLGKKVKIRADGKFGVDKKTHKHQWIDFAIAEGTPIKSICTWEVTETWFDEKGGGNYIKIRSADGKEFAYLHMKNLSTLVVGDKVLANQEIGKVGNTGSSSHWAHLHLMLKEHGIAQDPQKILPQLFSDEALAA